VQVIGCSFDTPAKNAKFKSHEKFKFALWSDVERELALYYGAAKKKSQSNASRITVILDPAGTWRYWYSTFQIGFDMYNHPKTILEDLTALLSK